MPSRLMFSMVVNRKILSVDSKTVARMLAKRLSRSSRHDQDAELRLAEAPLEFAGDGELQCSKQGSTSIFQNAAKVFSPL